MTARDAILTVAVMALWGFNFVAAKPGLAQIPPILLMAMRFTLVAALLLPFVRLPRGKLGGILALSSTLGCLHFSLCFTALRDLDVATAAIISQTQVPFAALLGAVFLGDRLRWRSLLGLAIAFAGVVLIAGEPRLSADVTPLLLMIAASFMWAVSSLQIKKLGPVNGFALSAYMSAFAVPQLVVASALLESGQLAALAHADWRAYASLAYMAIAVTIAGYAAWYYLLRSYPVNLAMPYTLLLPVFGVVSGVLVLGDPFGGRVLVGSLLTLAGVAILVVRRPYLVEPGVTPKPP